MRRVFALCLAAMTCIAGLDSAAAQTDTQPAREFRATEVIPVATTGNHFISNLQDSTEPRLYGFNIFDMGPYAAEINALPDGVRALVWLGQKCPTSADDAFRAKVDRLAKNPKVFGYYLSDEPHIADCPRGPAALATRTKYIALASAGRQMSFIVLSKVVDFAPFAPANTGVSLVGLDPYPCSISNPTCDLNKINERVSSAVAKGIPVGKIVPVYQAFGQERTASHYYSLPTRDQMLAMLNRWARLVPAPKMDYAYSWGHQGGTNPTLQDSLGLKSLFTTYFAS